MFGVTRGDVDSLLACMEAGDVERAVQQTMVLYEGGVGVDALVTHLLAAAQRETGERWATGRWSVAQEHTATAVVDACLSALGATDPAAPRGDDDWILIAAVEGDWHACPARMMSESLRANGWRVRFLGGSVSGDRLRSALADGPPRAVLLSCALTSAIPGAARCLDSLAECGVRVIVGGAAFGDDPARAVRLGACWAPDATDAMALIEREPGELVLPRVRAPEFERLDLERAEVACEVFDSLLLACPPLAACSEAEVRDIRTNAEHMIGALVASQLVQDDAVFADFTAWLDTTVQCQPSYHPSGAEMLDALEEVLGRRVLLPTRALDAARERVVTRVTTRPVAHLYDAVGFGIRRTPGEDHAALDQPGNRLEGAADAIRARAQVAAERVGAWSEHAPAPASDALVKLRQQAERLLAGAPGKTGDGSGARHERRLVLPDAARGGYASELDGNPRAAQVMEAARAQAARLLDEAEQDAARVRTEAEQEAEEILSSAHRGAADVLAHAEAEALEWLAEAGHQVVGHLDEVEAEAARMVATARAESARVNAEASRVHAEMTASAAETVQHAQQEAERQLAQAATTANALVAKARSDAAAIIAQAQAQRTQLADEAERLAAEASQLLELRLNEVEVAKAEAAVLRQTAEADIEADTRRLLGEAQADCDRIIGEAHSEAARIISAARAAAAPMDLRTDPQPEAPQAQPPAADELEAREVSRRRRFRP